MTETKSELTILAERLSDAMETMYEVLAEQFTVPFGTEKVTDQGWLRNFRAMTQEQRGREIQRLGLDTVLEMLRGARNA